MLKSKLISILLFILINILSINEAESQLSILTCDAIILGGMRDCLRKFAPSNDENPCCSYRKFRACNAGLASGLRVAIRRANCPQSILAKASLNEFADQVAGVTLSHCKESRQICRKSGTPPSEPKRKIRPTLKPKRPKDTSAFPGDSLLNPTGLIQIPRTLLQSF